MRTNKPMARPTRLPQLTPKTCTLAGGVLLLALSGVGAWHYQRPQPEATPAARSNAAQVEAANLVSAWTYRLEVGKAYVYDLSQTTDVRREKKPYANVTGKGRLEAHVVQAHEDSLDLIVRIDYEGSAGVALSPGGALQRSPLVVDESAHLRIARNGKVLALARVPGQAAKSQIFTTLLGSWLYVLPRFQSESGAIEAGPFFAEAVDGSGEFSVRYDLSEKAADPLRVTMRKERYQRASALTRMLSSEHQLAWSLAGGHLLNAKREERYEKGARELGVEVKDSGEITFVAQHATGFTPADLKRYTHATAMYLPEIASQEHVFALDENKVRSWEDLQADLRRLPSDPESEKTLELFDQVATSLVKHPEMLPSVAEEAAAQPSGSDQYRMLVGAISNLGTRDAQNALIDLYDAKDDKGKDMVLKAQALMDAPATEETRSMLVDSVDHGKTPALRSGAGLALGSALRNLSGKDEDDSVEAARARIMKLWNEAALPNDKNYALQVIGNSGDAYFVGLLKSEILSAESLYRPQAVSALRFMKDDESAQLLGLSLRSTDAPQLQQAAVDALFYRAWRPEFMEPVVSCFLGAAQSDLRIRCARAALQQPSQQQEMHAVLEKVRRSGQLDESLSSFIDSVLM